MVYIPAIDVAKVAIDQLFGQQALTNIIYFLSTTGWTPGSLDILCDEVVDWWTTNIAPLMNDALSLVGVTATDLTTETSPSVTVPVSPAVAGARTEAASPANAAATVTFRTVQRGRSSRGRNYVSGLSDGFGVISPTAVGTGYASDLATAYAALEDVEAAVNAVHSVVSFFSEKAPRTTAQILPVLSYTCDTLIDSQRRRLAGRGV